MKKIMNIQPRSGNLLKKIRNHKKLLIVAAIIVIIACAVVVVLVINPFKASQGAKSETKTVDSSLASTISVKTTSLDISEWKVQIPVNGNILGELTYTMNSDKTELRFVSSKLNEIDLSSSDCPSSMKGAWGIKRFAKKAKYTPGRPALVVGDYEYQSVSPDGYCDKLKEVSGAFNYSIIHLVEKK